MKLAQIAACVLVVSASVASIAATAQGATEPGILMGAEQKANWENESSPCPKSKAQYCADEISQAQFVAWPFVAEHTGTVKAVFAALATGETTGAEVGIFANRKYHFAEIEYRGEEENGAKETWTPAMFMQYEFEIPPEDPGALLGTSGEVPESEIVNNGWTEFKLQTPVKVVKGQKYWLTNTTFQKAYSDGSAEFHKYQLFYHERVSNTEDQPWGNYTNEPHNWEQVPRTLKELPSPEQTKINCEKCNTEGWLQEEPKGFDLLNTNRGAQEEGGQTYSYASGTIEEGQEAPAVQTEAAQVTKSRATVKATVNPNGEELSDCSFEYGPTTSYGSTAPCTPQPAESESPTPVAATIRELSAYTVYHYRITATNASGTSNGGDQTFRTLSAGPTVQTDSADEIAQTHATLTATVNPNDEEVSDCTLEYGPTTGYGSSAPCTPQPGAGETATAVSATVSGLAANVTYHYRVTATSTGGTTTGIDRTFNTLPFAPTVRTEAAGEVTQTGVTLNATVNPGGGQLSDCSFEYGPTTSYGSTAPCTPEPGDAESPVTATIGGLSANTTYHYRIAATNSGGTGTGTDDTVETLPAAPAVHTDSAGEIAQAYATLNAVVDPNGGELSDCTIEYGPTTSYGASASCSPQPGAGDTPTTVSATVSGLAANTTYHYRITATNAGGTSNGGDQTFKTLPPAPTVNTEAANEITETGATLSGTVNPNGAELSDCTFEYGPTTGYGASAPCSPQGAAGKEPASVTAEVSGLTAASTYYYRITATNAGGRSVGTAHTLTTHLSSAPLPQEPLAPSSPSNPQQAPGQSPPGGGEQAPRGPGAAPRLASTTLSADATGLVKDQLSCPITAAGCVWNVVILSSTAIVVSVPAHGKKPRPQVVTLARGTFSAAAGRTATITLRLSGLARRLLARTSPLTARAVITYTVAGASASTQTLVKIRAPKRPQKLHFVDRRADA